MHSLFIIRYWLIILQRLRSPTPSSWRPKKADGVVGMPYSQNQWCRFQSRSEGPRTRTGIEQSPSSTVRESELTLPPPFALVRPAVESPTLGRAIHFTESTGLNQLISSGNTSQTLSEIMFYQLAGQPVTQSSGRQK